MIMGVRVENSLPTWNDHLVDKNSVEILTLILVRLLFVSGTWNVTPITTFAKAETCTNGGGMFIPGVEVSFLGKLLEVFHVRFSLENLKCGRACGRWVRRTEPTATATSTAWGWATAMMETATKRLSRTTTTATTTKSTTAVESTILLVSLINQALDSSSMFTNVCY